MKRRISEIARFSTRPREVAGFYAGILDTNVTNSEGEAFSFDVEGVNLFIHPVDDSPPEPGWPAGVDHIAFEVEQLDDECDRLRAAGYHIQGPRNYPWGRSAYLSDPDGRLVELHRGGTTHE